MGSEGCLDLANCFVVRSIGSWISASSCYVNGKILGILDLCRKTILPSDPVDLGAVLFFDGTCLLLSKAGMRSRDIFGRLRLRLRLRGSIHGSGSGSGLRVKLFDGSGSGSELRAKLTHRLRRLRAPAPGSDDQILIYSLNQQYCGS